MTGKKSDPYTSLLGFFNEIGIIDQLVQTALGRALPQGLSPSQFGVLNHFAHKKAEESPAQLAKVFQVTKGAMTNTLGKLETQRFVTIRPDPSDGRAKLVKLTPKGLQAQKESLKAIRPLLKTLGKKMDVAKLIDALPALEELRHLLDTDRDRIGYNK
ncbi:MAG: DNA-binding MarR family transcriptional regulator [Parvibaculaceae bacterium]|nr:MarR family transcriptional regulator [Parvibaculaceae bacterium]